MGEERESWGEIGRVRERWNKKCEMGEMGKML